MEVRCVCVCVFVLLTAAEDAFLSACVLHINSQALQFKLAPTYLLYMAARFRLARPPHAPPPERAHLTNRLLEKTCDVVHQVIQVRTAYH